MSENTKRMGMIVSGVVAVVVACLGSYFGGAYNGKQEGKREVSLPNLEVILDLRDEKLLKAIEKQMDRRLDGIDAQLRAIAAENQLRDERINAMRERMSDLKVMATNIEWIKETVNELKAKTRIPNG